MATVFVGVVEFGQSFCRCDQVWSQFLWEWLSLIKVSAGVVKFGRFLWKWMSLVTVSAGVVEGSHSFCDRSQVCSLVSAGDRIEKKNSPVHHSTITKTYHLKHP